MLSNEIGHDLARALEEIEKARIDLVTAPLEEVGEKAFAYIQTRNTQSEAFAAAQSAYEEQVPPVGTPPKSPPVEGAGGAAGETVSDPASAAEPATEEASPGVNLIRPPGTVVDPQTIDGFGPIARYAATTKSEGEEAWSTVIEATEYAFAAGTAVQTADGQIATAQPSRIIRSATGGELAIVTNDVFIVAYEPAPAESAAPAPEAPAAPDPTA